MSAGKTGRASNPFRAGTVALVVLVGALAFLLALFAIGKGWTGGGDRNGGEHAASTGLTGYAALYSLLDGTEHSPSLSYSQSEYDAPGLLVLTPPHNADAEAITDILQQRMYDGPTLLILPKWFAMPIPDQVEVEKEPGWVVLGGMSAPQWFAGLDLDSDAELANGSTARWTGFGLRGTLPDPDNMQALRIGPDSFFEPLVTDAEGDMLAGLTYYDDGVWPLVVVFEPDLMNNYGMADETRGRLAHQLIHVASDGDDLPVIFDLTLAGLGSSENLLTLAFAPPFLAATLCLILAALVVGWRSFRRFGPPVAQAPAMARGKRQLALNGAALLARVKRWHLLVDPYAALVGTRIAAKLGIRDHEQSAREQAIDHALARTGHGGPTFSSAAHGLRSANGPGEILRAARTLKSIERTLTR